jgi:hypothetical protein
MHSHREIPHRRLVGQTVAKYMPVTQKKPLCPRKLTPCAAGIYKTISGRNCFSHLPCIIDKNAPRNENFFPPNKKSAAGVSPCGAFSF